MMKISDRTNQGALSTQSVHSRDVTGTDSSRAYPVEVTSKQALTRRTSIPSIPSASFLERTIFSQRRPLSAEKRMESARASCQPSVDVASSDEQILTKNLLGHLNVRSFDSLNIMRQVFEFHHYDTTLLDRYIQNKSPQNLSALTMQIEKKLFI
jgi:hypothetical protein